MPLGLIEMLTPEDDDIVEPNFTAGGTLDIPAASTDSPQPGTLAVQCVLDYGGGMTHTDTPVDVPPGATDWSFDLTNCPETQGTSTAQLTAYLLDGQQELDSAGPIDVQVNGGGPGGPGGDPPPSS